MQLLKKFFRKPDFFKVVNNYKMDASSINTVEEGRKNFEKCFDLFKTLCVKSWYSDFNYDEILLLNRSTINFSYISNKVFNNECMRIKLILPYLAGIHKNEFHHYIPMIELGHCEDSSKTEEIYKFFIYQFIQKNIIIKFL